MGNHSFGDKLVAPVIDHGDPMSVVNPLSLRPNLLPNHFFFIALLRKGLSVGGGKTTEIDAFLGLGDIVKDNLVGGRCG